MIENQTNRKHEHRPLLDFYVCMNDPCPFFGKHGERAAGDDNMTEETLPSGYYQGHPVCCWCDTEMEIAHTDELATPPHIEWDGDAPAEGKYYQLHF